jgi:hypothetical protein
MLPATSLAQSSAAVGRAPAGAVSTACAGAPAAGHEERGRERELATGDHVGYFACAFLTKDVSTARANGMGFSIAVGMKTFRPFS